MSRPSDLIQGTLDLLILKTVAPEPRHGWAIAKRIQRVPSPSTERTSIVPPCASMIWREM